ncbi:MAG: hypothetical protein ABIY51_02710 [Ferruginibacter sp.]
MDWTFPVSYKSKEYNIKASLIYDSSQVQRIKVYGSKSYIVLQNNFPLLNKQGNTSKGIKWQILEGEINDAKLLTHIIYYLEEIIKKEMKENSL